MNIKDEYKIKKQMIEAISNADHPLHKELSENLTVAQAIQLEADIAELEDYGVQLLKEAN